MKSLLCTQAGVAGACLSWPSLQAVGEFRPAPHMHLHSLRFRCHSGRFLMVDQAEFVRTLKATVSTMSTSSPLAKGSLMTKPNTLVQKCHLAHRWSTVNICWTTVQTVPGRAGRVSVFLKLMFVFIDVHVPMQNLLPFFLILVIHLKPLAYVLERLWEIYFFKHN